MLFLNVFSIIFIFTTLQEIKIMFIGELYFAARNWKPVLNYCFMDKDTEVSFWRGCATKKTVLPCYKWEIV